MTDMVVTTHRWRTSHVQRTIHDKGLEQSPWWNSEAKTDGWMEAWKGHCQHHAVVGLDATGAVQPCICMAGLLIFRQFVQICTSSSWHASLPSHCIHSASEHIIPSYWIFIFLKGILAFKFYSQVSFEHYKPQEQYQPSGILHAVWRILLDDDFIEAYCNGVIIECFNGIERHVYPRIFTYAVDYPEKCTVN